MTNYILKVKLSEYYPKIDTIPYNHYICLIIYNNYYSKIKLSKKTEKFFQHNLRIINNSDIILQIKLLDSIQSNIIGKGDLLIPFIKLEQIINNYKNFLSYHQLFQLSLETKIVVKSYNKIMNIKNIYLDFIIELYSINNHCSLIKNDINCYKTLYSDRKKSFGGTIQLNNSIKNNKGIYKNCYNMSNNNIHEFDNNYNSAHNRYLGKIYNHINHNDLNYISIDNNNNYHNYNFTRNKTYENLKLNPSEISLFENQ